MGQPPEKLTVMISDGVADCLETPIEELPPLYDTIDPEALEALVPPTAHDSSSDLTVAFQHAGLRVCVYPGKTVYVRPISSAQEEPVDMA